MSSASHINYEVGKHATYNCKDARTAISRHPPRSAIDGCPDLGKNHESRIETHGFLSNLPSQFYGFRQ